MFYVYSTLTCDNFYVLYAKNESKDISVAQKKILIRGGHGVATKHFVTPQGVLTQISDEDMEILQKDIHFQNHVKKGFIKFEKKKSEPEKVAQDMAQKDGSAPLTPKDFEKAADDDGIVKYKVKGKK